MTIENEMYPFLRNILATFIFYCACLDHEIPLEYLWSIYIQCSCVNKFDWINLFSWIVEKIIVIIA